MLLERVRQLLLLSGEKDLKNDRCKKQRSLV